MRIDPDKLFDQVEKDRCTETFKAQFFEHTEYVYESVQPKEIVQISRDGQRSFGLFNNGVFTARVN